LRKAEEVALAAIFLRAVFFRPAGVPALSDVRFFGAEGLLLEAVFLRAVPARVRRAPARLADDAAALLRLPFRLPGRGWLVACLPRALPRAVLAPSVFRPLPAVRAFARAPVAALRFEWVSFRPRFLLWVFALFFLAIYASGE
jgi:hypothetical protein